MPITTNRLLANFTGALPIHPHSEHIRKSSPILCSVTSQCPIVLIPYWKTYLSRRESLSRLDRPHLSQFPQSKSIGKCRPKPLCDLHCQFDHVDLCSVTDMAKNIPSLTPIDPSLLRGLNGRMFRFLVMLDPDVDIFISRDIDSVIWQREVDAVDQWLSSNFTFHLMRDHKLHSATILAGILTF